jgi:hypothetical protein
MEKAIIETTMVGGLIIAGAGCLGYGYDKPRIYEQSIYYGSGIAAIGIAWLIAYKGI